MSSIYLGPFVKAPVQYDYFDRDVRTCGEHPNYKGDKFCPVCGREIMDGKLPAKCHLLPEELFGHERLFHEIREETMYLMVNERDGPGLFYGLSDAPTTITPEIVSDCMATFAERYAREIAILEALPGVGKLVVEFGLVPMED